jgi:flavin reductase (DIM6/NTAB) family NADH-FMN oxidoreductase RutF
LPEGPHHPRQHPQKATAGPTSKSSQRTGPLRPAEAPAALERSEHPTIGIGRSRIVLGCVVAIYIEDRFVDPAGPYIIADKLHAIGRMNALGNQDPPQETFQECLQCRFSSSS